MKKILTKKGFTLIELIVVIAILAILAAILIPSIINYIDAANDAKYQSDTRSEYTRVVLSHATTNGSPVESDGTTAIATAVAYELYADFDCTVTFDASSVSAFACTDGTKTWSLANNFNP